MTSGSDDLEQELRRNLKLRRELGAEAAKGKAALNAKQRGGFAYRLGRVLYWTCLVLGAVWVGVVLWFGLVDFETRNLITIIGVFIVPIFVLYGMGRGLRYILSGE